MQNKNKHENDDVICKDSRIYPSGLDKMESLAEEPQKLDMQSVYHWNRLFISFSKIQLSDTLGVLVKLHPDYKSQ